MQRAWYFASLSEFTNSPANDVLKTLAAEAAAGGFPPLETQLAAWERQIAFLQGALRQKSGSIYFEFAIPRMGSRADVVLLVGGAIFVLEFKVGERVFTRSAREQVWDYALDLKNFHETSHAEFILPMLIVTEADSCPAYVPVFSSDRTSTPICTTLAGFPAVLDAAISSTRGKPIDAQIWQEGRYRPTPTIIEAARALYSRHSVEDICRKEADAINLGKTSGTIEEIIKDSKSGSRKSICFVTGVPGAGKTLVGLNTATRYMDKRDELYSVFLSGNGPLVKVLCEALARDKVQQSKKSGPAVRLGEARSRVKAFIQNVHHFRDECLKDGGPPVEHVALFDEAQRAWDLKQTAQFMKQKKKRPDFEFSEPEYLISCLDRHHDWAVVICLVGGGQEIHRGEAGIGEWICAINRRFPDWRVFISPQLTDSEYGAGETLQALAGRPGVEYRKDLHLGTSMRSFRAENVSLLIKQILDLDVPGARRTLETTRQVYPIVLTRQVESAKQWLKAKARGSERYGIVVSSQAERLRPHAISVHSPIDPVHWFLDAKEDVRSSYYLEDVATEFHVQGLELDWTCVTWDGDLRYGDRGWSHWSFQGHRWNQIRKDDRKRFLTNAYRVLLTRARQGMVIVVPEGDPRDPTRSSEYYDPTFQLLRDIGIPEL